VGESAKKKIRWSIERRLEFIDFRLYWEGRINRSDLVEFFGISIPQASADLSRYQLAAKDNLLYDKVAKTYVASPSFRPLVLDPSADRYLAQLRLIAAALLPKDESWLDHKPSFATVPVVRRHLDAERLRGVIEGIRLRAAMHVRYQSFSSSEPEWRWITPHALAFDGHRWHARAWCHRHEAFRDFVLARILEIGDTKPDDIDAGDDREWEREVTLRLAPHPNMEDGPRRAIELDFGMVNGVLELTTKVCLSAYLERQLGLDLDPKLIPSQRQQIVLINRAEVENARNEARAASCAALRTKRSQKGQ
jgi:hypothetical protein